MTPAEQLRLADLQKERARVELDWERRLPQLKINARGKRAPSRTWALYLMLMGGGFAAFVLKNNSGANLAIDRLAFPLGLSASFIAIGIWVWHKATVYQRELRVHEAEVARVSAEIENIKRRG